MLASTVSIFDDDDEDKEKRNNFTFLWRNRSELLFFF